MRELKYVACIVLYNEKNEILCVSRKDDHTDMGLPGGKKEKQDKNLKHTAIRETFEETGIKIKPKDLQLIYVSPDSNGFLVYTYYCNVYTGEINHNEPHIVKWGTSEDLIRGSFGIYNLNALHSILHLLK